MIREYQSRALEAYLAHHHRTGAMFVMATGTGKTYTAHLVIDEYLKKGKRVLWLAHQTRLVKQPLTKDGAMRRFFPQHLPICGIVQGQANQAHDKQMVYASIQTLARQQRLDKLLAFGDFDLVVVDEAHHSVSATTRRLIDTLRSRGCHLLGLTATPDREDTKKLTDLWEVVFSYTITDALSAGALLPPYAALDRVPDLDLSKVGGRKDYTAPDLERALLKAHIVEHTVAAVRKRHVASRLPFGDHSCELECSTGSGGGIVYTATVEQARLTAEALKADGWNAEHISGETPEAERDALFEAFDAGVIDILCNAQLVTEGVDLPRAGWEVLARPTKSWSLYVQMVGRVLRPYGDQTKAFVLDLVGATRVHSIVAAPVLVDGIDCEASESGQHRFIEINTGEGRCLDCGKVIACFARLGGHRFVDGKCRGCGALQCKASSSGQHEWVPWDNSMRKCVECGLEMLDSTASLMKPPTAREKIAWHKLALPGEVWASNLGRHGVLMMVSSGHGLWLPLWATIDGRLLRLAPRPVVKEMTHALLDDVARRATKVNGIAGAAPTNHAAKRLVMDATHAARRHLVWTLGS